MRRLTVLSLLFSAGLAVACLDPGPYEPKIWQVGFDTSLHINLAEFTPSPSGLFYKDLTLGAGIQVPASTSGDTVKIRYRLWLRNGVAVDSNTAPGASLFSFITGSGAAITGMDEGVRGMRVGGARQLLVPSSLGYGTSGSGSIPPSAILVFRVDLVDVDTLTDTTTTSEN